LQNDPNDLSRPGNASFGVPVSSHNNEHGRLEVPEDLFFSSIVNTFVFVLVRHGSASMGIHS
jgi:hypothetical protein